MSLINGSPSKKEPACKELAKELFGLSESTRGSGFPSGGERWTKATVNGKTLLGKVLTGRSRIESSLFDEDLRSDCDINLHCFLQRAVQQAIRLAAPDALEQEQAAGALYLHDPVHDELVLAASAGFPMRSPPGPNQLKPGARCFVNPADSSEDAGSKSEKRSELCKANIRRLAYIEKVLGPRLGSTSIRRDPWVREELRFVRSERRVSNLDCNKSLIGVAYYKPGATGGITAQLFDREQAPKLERIEMDDGFVKDLKSRLTELVRNPAGLSKHIVEDLLWKWTIVYSAREQMAAGRQVRAGVYEGMQYPTSDYIGPFLGTTLCFNGERFGILKVEKHRFVDWQTTPSGKSKAFGSSEVAGFLLLAYSLAGALYLLKYHMGVDLSFGWRDHWVGPDKCSDLHTLPKVTK